MKPNFTLSLSFEGIRLLHRAAGGWRIVGEVALDATDMGAELAVLRRTATALEPGGLRTKLLLPDGQIKYLTIDTKGMDEQARVSAARAALEGATPYDVDDLVFDLSADGDQSHIAAVARETLTEAEAFAVENRFYPVCFAAAPENSAYLGEPFFGPTRSASQLLDTGEEVEPDGIAVVVIGDVEDVADASEIETADTAVTGLDQTPEPVNDAVDTPALEERVTSVDYGNAAPEQEQDGQISPLDAAAQRQPDVPVKPKLGAATRITAPSPATSPPAPTPGFSSRRGTIPDAPGRQEPLVAAPTLQTETDVAAAPTTQADAPPSPDSSSLRAEPIVAAVASAGAPVAGFLSRRRAQAGAAIQRRLNFQRPAIAGTAPVVAEPRTEAERMTVFGARHEDDIGGKPRYLGLILITALLVFLAGVAAWASVFLDDGLNLSRLLGNRETVAATTPSPVASETETPMIVEVEDDVEPVVTASLSPALTEEDTAVLDALSTPVVPRDIALSPEEQEAKYAATGIWPVAPQVPPDPAGLIDIDDLYMTSIDPVSTSNDAIALPAVSGFATDTALSNVPAPLAAGTLFALDDSGLVVPTAQGAISPDGITVYLGRPPAVPPTTPTRFRAIPTDDRIREALAAFRPQTRPDDLAETTERAQLDGLTRTELSELRPQLRPRSVQELAQANALAEAEAAAATAAAAVAVTPQDTEQAVQAAIQASAFQNPTRLAIKASTRPDVRPRNFARIVRRAQRTPQPQADRETRVAAAATIAPRTVSPKIPSKTSVAKQATVRNAINLRKVNLIGVYGKPSSRRALVRLGNGRYKKVVVGDRIDGGRVSAIGDSELRYTKGGRNLVLKMPSG
ncbi:hypothetical protein [Sulfitobacter aestuariivivens]|uniref:Type IV pilus biogenesis n=1 Tax=Sulfitobacter aestuariivivens TaxID=2766981 RepID=A0A927D584_9RHOB|nr:hypothetical protein [Sulfitobacter aestuariivivens]MBD3663677.1 hypothetical protein [Sulfitobacter aestuariivivens]